MSWHEAVAEMAEGLDEEFGAEAIHSPMIAKPNERWRPDPARPGYMLIGIFAERQDWMGAGQRAATRDGLKHTRLSSSSTTFSALRCAFTHAPTQGDRITIVHLGRDFRVQDISYLMPTRMLLTLESIEAIPAS